MRTVEYWVYEGEKGCDEDDVLLYKYTIVQTHQSEPEFCIKEYRWDIPPSLIAAQFDGRQRCPTPTPGR